MPSNKFLFVINPTAGGNDNADQVESIQQLCVEKGLDCAFVQTDGGDLSQLITQAIQKEQPDAVIACGGDGTVNQVGSLLLGSDLPMGIIPFGSANGLAVSLDLPQNVEDCLEAFLKKNIIKMDVLRLNGQHLCFHQSSVGMNAKLIKYREQAGHKGMWGYVRHFFRTLLEFNTKKYTVKTNGESMQIRADMITFANGRKYGTGALVNPTGEVDDGQFEVCIFKPFPLYAIAGITFRFFTGHLHKSPYTRYIRTKTVEISSKYPLLLEVDGDLKGYFQTIEVEILPGVLKVLV